MIFSPMFVRLCVLKNTHKRNFVYLFSLAQTQNLRIQDMLFLQLDQLLEVRLIFLVLDKNWHANVLTLWNVTELGPPIF